MDALNDARCDGAALCTTATGGVGDTSERAALAGKQVFDGKGAVFPAAGDYVSQIGTAWPASVSANATAAGVFR